MNKNTKRKRKGFTLIELIIVLAIMAIIAAIAIPNFSAIRDNSKTKADKQSANTIKRNVMMLVSDESIKPCSVEVTATFTTTSSVTYSATDDAATAVKEGFTADEKTLFQKTLSEVKKPQSSGGTGYVVTINTDGSIAVTVSGTSVVAD